MKHYIRLFRSMYDDGVGGIGFTDEESKMIADIAYQRDNLQSENEVLREALKPLAGLDLAGLKNGDTIIYQRNKSKILVSDVVRAIEALNSLTPKNLKAMGLFSKPKCPRCGSVIVRTGYSFPYAQWRCNNCVNQSKREQEMQNIKELFEKRIKSLEEKIDKSTLTKTESK